MSEDLVVFLNARLDDDERIARAAAKETDRDWDATVDPDPRYTYRAFLAGDNDPFAEVSFFTAWEAEAPNIMPHIARHDPARVLADVQAKRAIIAAISQWQHDDPDDGGFYACPATRTEPLGDLGPESFGEENCTCGVLARRRQIATLLAQPYADRPGFRQEWLA
jgi:hypothetical protein